jgi:hypothetical protein
MTSKTLSFATFLSLSLLGSLLGSMGCGGTKAPPGMMPTGPDTPADSPTVKGVDDRTAGNPTPSNPPTGGNPSNPPAPSPSPDPGMNGGGTVISFSQDVVPIFSKRLCIQCHTGDGPGKDEGGLALDGSISRIYRELTVAISPNFDTTRVDLNDPEKSLLLTMPGPEVDPHPVVVFTSSADPDYQTILQWIRQGAKLN